MWKPDVASLIYMARRLADLRGRKPVIGAVTDTALTGSVLETLVGAGVSEVSDEGPVDILFTDASPREGSWKRLRQDGFVMGLNAHRIDYAQLGLAHARPIGDHMWIGSRVAFDPEDLFDGGTLVKFGVPREY
jgi:hypothetical protein